MSKNRSVEELFQLGYKEATQENNARIALERETQRIWLKKWSDLLKAAMDRIPEKEIANHLVITDERYIDHQSPPDELNRVDFSIIIDGYAPIKVIFDHPYPSEESKVIDITYKVPRLDFDEDNNKLVFWWSLRGQGYRGSETQWITSLPRALYEARCMNVRMNKFQQELNEKAAAKQEPEYIPNGDTVDEIISRLTSQEISKALAIALMKVAIG